MKRLLRMCAPVVLGLACTALSAAEPSLWSKTASGTKRALNTTVNVVTLKPVRDYFAPKKPKSNLGLGFKPDPRKAQPQSSSLFGSWFKPKPKSTTPQTVGEFLSMDRPK
jgi:hypothetical protein